MNFGNEKVKIKSLLQNKLRNKIQVNSWSIFDSMELDFKKTGITELTLTIRKWYSLFKIFQNLIECLSLVKRAREINLTRVVYILIYNKRV